MPLHRCRTAIPLQALEECLVQVLVRVRSAAALPVAAAQECLPLWLEAAGWVVAISADAAAAAAVGTWHQQGQQQPTSSSSNCQVRVYGLVDVCLIRRTVARCKVRSHWQQLKHAPNSH